MRSSTLVALAALVVIGLSSFIASNLLKQKFTFFPKAQQSTIWSLDAWDEAANRCPDKGSGLGPCICTQLQSDGICAPVGSINPKGLTCIKNKWGTTWGCWGTPSSANVPGTPDSSSAPSGDSCGLTRSQYGTCPDWATENSCHQRLDPPGDPDYGKWFKCVNRWWNGPCDSKEVCEGSVAAPPAEAPSTAVDTSAAAPVGPVDRSAGLCWNYNTQTNCEATCKSNAEERTESDFSDWYCNENREGDSDKSGQYCCPPELSALTPTPAPGTLGGACGYYINVGCDPGLKCVNLICEESTSSPTPSTPTPAVIAGNEEGTCTASGKNIKIRASNDTITESNNGPTTCGNSVLVGEKGDFRVYRICQNDSSKECLYACYNKQVKYNCLSAGDQSYQNVVRVLNKTAGPIILNSIKIKKHVFWIGDGESTIAVNYPLPIGETYTVDFSNDTSVSCGALSFSRIDVEVFYKDNFGAFKFIETQNQLCTFGIQLLLVINNS